MCCLIVAADLCRCCIDCFKAMEYNGIVLLIFFGMIIGVAAYLGIWWLCTTYLPCCKPALPTVRIAEVKHAISSPMLMVYLS